MALRSTLTVSWLSAGVSSFIASYLVRNMVDNFVYIDISDQHPDSIRFIRDCEKLLPKPVEVISSTEYNSVDSAIRSAGVVRMVRTGFAPCTNFLKKRVRKQWEYNHPDCDFVYVWGFDCSERSRAERLVDAMPLYQHIFPLIDNNLSKEDCHALLYKLGVKRPIMYDLGYQNNNCVGCVKGGAGYWNRIRVDFPDVFRSRACLERDIGSRCLKDYWLDELPEGVGRFSEDIPEDCGIFCEIAYKKF